jgi:alpha-tubulin suppressor-like RCC1 family protein
VVTTPVYSLFAAGNEHSLAVRPAAAINVSDNGTLYSSGRNFYGQLGDGTTNDKSAFTQVGTDSTWSSVALGDLHSLALRADGSLYTWGYNFNGQLGTGNTTPKYQPTKILLPAKSWISIAAGASHSLALSSDFKLWSWGQNAHGQLGDISLIDKSIPTAILSSATWKWKSIAAGFTHSVAVRSGTGATCGAGSSNIWVWGGDLNGQLGLDNNQTSRNVPTCMPNVPGPAALVAAGDTHTLAILSDGTLYSWGGNANNQLGQGPGPSSNFYPTKIGIDTPSWATVSAGGAHSMATKTDGSLWAWGSNADGQLGFDSSVTEVGVPTQVGTAKDWKEVSAGKAHTLARKLDGSLYAWGKNANGQLGNGTLVNVVINVP